MTLMISPESRAHLRANITRNEAYRQFAYKDTTGHLTIGIGRNLDSHGVSMDEALMLMDNDIQRVEHELWNAYPSYASLCDVRKAVLIEMAFELGVVGLMAFRDMINAINVSNWHAAAQAMLDSVWAHQVGARAVRLSQTMETGVLHV